MARGLVLCYALVQVNAFPNYALSYTAETVKTLQPGDPFNAPRMQISTYEAEHDENCIITSDIPSDGFESGQTYSISVDSSTGGGVGHVIITSGGEFDSDGQGDTHLSEQKQTAATGFGRHASFTWKWFASADAERTDFYAICASGVGGTAWLAEPVVFPKAGAQTSACALNDQVPVGLECLCPAASSSTCSPSECCFRNSTCGTCVDGPSDTPVLPASTSTPALLWIHAILMVLAWACCMPLGVVLAKQRQRVGPSWFLKHRAIQSSGFVAQIVGFICIVIYVGGKGLPHFSGPSQAHMITGLGLVVLSTLQVFFAMLRPPPTPPAQGRLFWQYTHKSYGYTMLVLGPVVIVMGLLAAQHDGALLVVASIVASLGFGCAAAALLATRRVELNPSLKLTIGPEPEQIPTMETREFKSAVF